MAGLAVRIGIMAQKTESVLSRGLSRGVYLARLKAPVPGGVVVTAAMPSCTQACVVCAGLACD